MDVLINKTAKTGNYFSRNNGFYFYYNKLDAKETYVRDNKGNKIIDLNTGRALTQKVYKEQLSTKSWLQTVPAAEETKYTVKEGDTYDSIALEYYNNPTYYWIICDYNRIIDPFVEPKKGDILYLPTLGTNIKFENY